jgi:hypothetical protein
MLFKFEFHLRLTVFEMRQIYNIFLVWTGGAVKQR